MVDTLAVKTDNSTFKCSTPTESHASSLRSTTFRAVLTFTVFSAYY